MNKLSDHLGIILSCTCIIHCVALPILVLFMQIPNIPETFHEIMLGLALLVSGHALYHGWKKHCRHIVLFFGLLGLLCMLSALAIYELESILTTIGAILVVGAHVVNLKSANACCDIH